jgi:RNA polymerase sigma-70 factor (ECF subfamily)
MGTVCAPGTEERGGEPPRSTAPTACPPDEAVLAAVASGEAEALGALYDRYGRLAFAVAYRVLDDPTAAEDAVQDAFLAVWRRAASYRPERGSVRGWLLAVVRNAAIDRRRGRYARARQEASVESQAERLPAADDPSATALATVEAERVRAALLALPAGQRRVVELAYDVGLTHAEIAARIGAPLGTVKGRMRLALAKLRLSLGDLLPPGPAPAGRTQHGDDRSPTSTPPVDGEMRRRRVRTPAEVGGPLRRAAWAA